jgi:hypothetical protein
MVPKADTCMGAYEVNTHAGLISHICTDGHPCRLRPGPVLAIPRETDGVLSILRICLSQADELSGIPCPPCRCSGAPNELCEEAPLCHSEHELGETSNFNSTHHQHIPNPEHLEPGTPGLNTTRSQQCCRGGGF